MPPIVRACCRRRRCRRCFMRTLIFIRSYLAQASGNADRKMLTHLERQQWGVEMDSPKHSKMAVSSVGIA